MSRLSLIAATSASLVLATGLLTPTLAAGAEENVFVDSYGVTAQVNRTGGITVSGKMNCKAAADRWEEQNGRELPADSTVNVGYSWTARQPLGRRGGYLVASFGSSHLQGCYNTSDPEGTDYSWKSDVYGSATPIYLYSERGAFKQGLVYVEVKLEGGVDDEGNQYANVFAPDGWTESVEVFNVTGFEVRATR